MKKKKKNPERKKTYPEFNRFEKYSINYQKKNKQTNKQFSYRNCWSFHGVVRERERKKKEDKIVLQFTYTHTQTYNKWEKKKEKKTEDLLLSSDDSTQKHDFKQW